MSTPPRVTSAFWVSAYLRRCASSGVDAVLRRRGATEAGAIFIVVDRLDGSVALLGPAPQSEADDTGGRRFAPLHKTGTIAAEAAETRLKREVDFDPDLWIVAVEDRGGRAFLD